MQQNILIVGGDNFVGRKLAATLRARGATVVVVNTASAAEVAASINTIDAVVSCTAGTPLSIQASARHLFACIKASTKSVRVVHVSSMTVYGSVEGDIDERQAFKTDLGAYAAARITAETYAKDCANVVTLRPGCEYGPECTHWSERVAQWLIAKRLGDLGAAGDGYCNLLYIDDLISAVVISLEKSGIEGQAFNLCSPEPLTWNDYFIRYAKALGAVPIKRISHRRLQLETKLLAPPLKVAEIIFGKHNFLPPALPPSALSVFKQELKMLSTKATAQLGIQWTAVDVGLARTAQATYASKTKI